MGNTKSKNLEREVSGLGWLEGVRDGGGVWRKRAKGGASIGSCQGIVVLVACGGGW